MVDQCDVPIPEGLLNLMEEISVQVLGAHPGDILKCIADYLDGKDGRTSNADPLRMQQELEGSKNNGTGSIGANKPIAVIKPQVRTTPNQRPNSAPGEGTSRNRDGNEMNEALKNSPNSGNKGEGCVRWDPQNQELINKRLNVLSHLLTGTPEIGGGGQSKGDEFEELRKANKTLTTALNMFLDLHSPESIERLICTEVHSLVCQVRTMTNALDQAQGIAQTIDILENCAERAKNRQQAQKVSGGGGPGPAHDPKYQLHQPHHSEMVVNVVEVEAKKGDMVGDRMETLLSAKPSGCELSVVASALDEKKECVEMKAQNHQDGENPLDQPELCLAFLCESNVEDGGMVVKRTSEQTDLEIPGTLCQEEEQENELECIPGVEGELPPRDRKAEVNSAADLVMSEDEEGDEGEDFDEEENEMLQNQEIGEEEEENDMLQDQEIGEEEEYEMLQDEEFGEEGEEDMMDKTREGEEIEDSSASAEEEEEMFEDAHGSTNDQQPEDAALAQQQQPEDATQAQLQQEQTGDPAQIQQQQPGNTVQVQQQQPEDGTQAQLQQEQVEGTAQAQQLENTSQPQNGSGEVGGVEGRLVAHENSGNVPARIDEVHGDNLFGGGAFISNQINTMGQLLRGEKGFGEHPIHAAFLGTGVGLLAYGLIRGLSSNNQSLSPSSNVFRACPCGSSPPIIPHQCFTHSTS